MSRHYLVMSEQVVSSANQVDEALRELAKKNPALARRLAKLDMQKLRSNIARSALAKTAEKHGYCIRKQYKNETVYGSASGDPNGECLGVIDLGDNRQLGLSQDKSGTLNFFWNDYSRTCAHAELEKLKKDFEIEFRKISIKSALAVTGHRVNESGVSGAVVITGIRAKSKVGGGK